MEEIATSSDDLLATMCQEGSNHFFFSSGLIPKVCLLLSLWIACLCLGHPSGLPEITNQNSFDVSRLLPGRALDIPGWEFGGSTISTDNFLRLTPAIRSRAGWVVNTEPLYMSEWQITFVFRVHGIKSPGADGIAFWLTEQPANQEGAVFGNIDEFKGLGIFMDTFDNDNKKNNPYISAMYSDGTQRMDLDHDNFNSQLTEGCVSHYRNADGPSIMTLRYYGRELSVDIDAKGDGKFLKCFSARVDIPAGYHLGVTAKTGGLFDNHDVYAVITEDLNPGQTERNAHAINSNRDAKSTLNANVFRGNVGREVENARNPSSAAAGENTNTPEAASATGSSTTPATERFRQAREKIRKLGQNRYSWSINKRDAVPDPTGFESKAVESELKRDGASSGACEKNLEAMQSFAQEMRDTLDAQNTVLEGIMDIMDGTARKSDLEEFLGASRQKLEQSFNAMEAIRGNLGREVVDMKSAVDTVKADISTLHNVLSDLSGGVANQQRASAAATSNLQGVLKDDISRLRQDVQSGTSFFFWFWFLLVQILLVVAFFIYRKYREEKTKFL